MDSRIIREWNLLKNWVNANGNVHSVRNFGLNANANGEDFLGHYSSLNTGKTVSFAKTVIFNNYDTSYMFPRRRHLDKVPVPAPD